MQPLCLKMVACAARGKDGQRHDLAGPSSASAAAVKAGDRLVFLASPLSFSIFCYPLVRCPQTGRRALPSSPSSFAQDASMASRRPILGFGKIAYNRIKIGPMQVPPTRGSDQPTRRLCLASAKAHGPSTRRPKIARFAEQISS